jgi:hypothetical protein
MGNMATTIQCPGCRRLVDVTAPEGMKHEVIHERDPDGKRVVDIVIERTSIHRCIECIDGEWR